MKSVFSRIAALFGAKPAMHASCRELNGFLGDYLDGELDASTAASYEAHLEKCPPCKGYFEQYRTTVELAHRCREAKLPEDLVEHTLEFLRNRRSEG